MLGVPCASVVLWLLVLLVPPVLSQTTRSVCHTEEHTDGSRQRIVYSLFAQQPNSIKEKCDETVCHAGLSTSANWTFSGFGLTFNQEQTAVRVESCHVHCLQRYGNDSASSRMRNLYAVSCQDNPQMYQCLGACLYHVCTTPPSGPDVVDNCSDGLMEIDVLCNSVIFSANSSGFSANGSDYTAPPFPNEIKVGGSFASLAMSALLQQPSSSAQTVARRYGLMTFDLSEFLREGVLSPGLVGVVWHLQNKFVPQHAVYRYLREELSVEDWESVRDQPIFTVPELQCNKFKEAYKLLNATHQTQWRRYLIDQCLIGRLYPDPPTTLTLCFYNETNRMPGLEVAFRSIPKPDVEGYGVIVSGKKKRVETNTFVEPACSLLASNSSEARAKFPTSRDGVVVLKGSAVPWEILWGCFDEVEVKIFSLPDPPKATGVEARYRTYQFIVPGSNTGSIGSVFYPPYSSKYSDSLLFINNSVQLNNSCSLDAVVKYSLLVSNASAVFLSEIRVNFFLGNNLPPVLITKEGTKLPEALNGTSFRSFPSPDGLMVVVQHEARGIHLDQVVEVVSDVKFDYNRLERVSSQTTTKDLRYRIPPDSTPFPVDNITMVGSTFTGKEVEAEFEWESPGTLCYPVHQYQVSVSSPRVEDLHRETFKTNATHSGQVVRYTLHISSYRADHYNLTVWAMFGREVGNLTEPSTLTFTLDVSEQPGTSLPAFAYGIIGGLLGVLFVIGVTILVVAVGTRCWYRKRNARAVIGKNTVVWIGGDTDSEGDFIFDPSNMDMNTFTPLDEWEIPPHEIIMDQKIADGNFGEVYKSSIVAAAAQSSPAGVQPGALVAVKMLKYDASDELKGEFLREIAIMKKVSGNHCPFVVNMVGCCTMQEPVCLVLEYVAHGSLLNYLRTMRKKVQLEGGVRVGSCDKLGSQGVGSVDNLRLSKSAEVEDTYWELGDLRPSHLISFAYQIACGMDYLASMHVIHRDLACRNILVDSDKMLKIADFGLSREGDTYVSHSSGQMPLRWMAIECIRERSFSSKSDVWAYGVTLWELCTLGGYPYPTHSNKEILETLQAGKRLDKPKNCTQDIYDIMLGCWQADRELRPTFAELRSQFDQMLSSKHKENYIHLLVDEEMPYYNLLPVEGKGSKESLPSLGCSPTPDPLDHTSTPDPPHGVESLPMPASNGKGGECGGAGGRDVLDEREAVSSPQWKGL